MQEQGRVQVQEQGQALGLVWDRGWGRGQAVLQVAFLAQPLGQAAPQGMHHRGWCASGSLREMLLRCDGRPAF